MDMETEQKFFVYVDFKEDDGKPFYVGKGNENRVKDLDRNQLHTNIKNKHGMVRKILLETLSEQEAFKKEIELIQELKTHIDLGEGGANFTLGGEGSSGYKFSEEQKEALRKKWENPEFREMMSESVKKSLNHERKQKIRESSKRRWEDPEYREKLRVVYDSPEYKEMKHESTRKVWEIPEHKEKMREIHRKKWEDNEYKEKQLKTKNSENCKKKTSESVKKLWEDPEHKERMRESLRRGWEKRRLRNLQQKV